jgi:hypothetical protein
MQNMEDLEVSKNDVDNNVEVVVEKGEYEH